MGSLPEAFLQDEALRREFSVWGTVVSTRTIRSKWPSAFVAMTNADEAIQCVSAFRAKGGWRPFGQKSAKVNYSTDPSAHYGPPPYETHSVKCAMVTTNGVDHGRIGTIVAVVN